jgi:hypothetical protein
MQEREKRLIVEHNHKAEKTIEKNKTMATEKNYREAIAYINENKTWSAEEEQVALEETAKKSCPLRRTSTGNGIINCIGELLDEFGTINNLSTDWWREFADSEEDVFWELE